MASAAAPRESWPDALADTLAQVRAQGWALVDQELESGLRSVAAPLHGSDGSVVAAINVSTATSSASLERIRDDFRPALLETAAGSMANWPGSTGGRSLRLGACPPQSSSTLSAPPPAAASPVAPSPSGTPSTCSPPF